MTEASLTYHEHIVKAALESVSNGYAIFLLAPNAKVPMAGTTDARKNASTNENEIRAWFAEHPQANYGVALQSRDLVIDCDPKNYPKAYESDGEDMTLLVPNEEKLLVRRHNVMLDLLRDCPALYKTRIVHTPNNGWHFYLRKPPDDLLQKKNLKYPGVDFLSEGFHVVGPGSMFHGKLYTLPEPRRALEIV